MTPNRVDCASCLPGFSGSEDLHYFVAEVVDDFDGDAAGGGFGEGAGGVAVEGRPGFGVDLGSEGGLEGLVGVVGAEEVGLADEEALLVVVGVDEPAGDAVRARRTGLRRCSGGRRPRR